MAVLQDKLANELCVHPLGFCNRMCNEIQFYPQPFYQCKLKCLKKHAIYYKMMMANKLKESNYPCKELPSGEKIQMLMKVDYKPVNDCSGGPNKTEEY